MTTHPSSDREKIDWEEVIGFNDRGIVAYWDNENENLRKAECMDCGEKIEGKEAIKWMFGHIGCKNPHGEFIKVDLTPKKLKSFIRSSRQSAVEEYKREILGKLPKKDRHGDFDTTERCGQDCEACVRNEVIDDIIHLLQSK